MENVGLALGVLEMYDYLDDYPKIYEKLKEELLNIYGDKIRYIDHIGSTSIINIKSKPVIDVMIQTDDLDDFKKYTEEYVENETYTVKREPTLGGDYLVRREEDGRVKAFLHVYQTGDINGLTSVYFRDYLNSHEDEKRRYEELKVSLFEKFKYDRKSYTLGKDSYIKSVIAMAIEERNKNI